MFKPRPPVDLEEDSKIYNWYSDKILWQMLHFNFKVFTYQLKHKFGIVYLKKLDEDSRI